MILANDGGAKRVILKMAGLEERRLLVTRQRSAQRAVPSAASKPAAMDKENIKIARAILSRSEQMRGTVTWIDVNPRPVARSL
jgi:hypothetical protein